MTLRILHWLSRRLWLRRIIGEDLTLYLERFRVWGWMPETAFAPATIRSTQQTRALFDAYALGTGAQIIDEGGYLRISAKTTEYPRDRPSGYLHRFHRPDLDDAPHNHPWAWAISLVLAGGYTERRVVDGQIVERRLRPGMVNVIRHDTYHVVTELHGRETWTLFLVGPKAQSWGFWVEGRGHVDWRTRLRERGLTPDY